MLKILLKVLKYFLSFIGIIIFIKLSVFYFVYIYCPIYDFIEPEKFKGSYIYNPYQNLETANWKKANLHVHSRAWGGVTNGFKNFPEVLGKLYDELEYDIYSISDYMRINDFLKDSVFYIPTYEHGYSIQKYHKLGIGAREVTYTDYPYFQTIHNKQHIIDLMKESCELVSLNHPSIRNAVTGYDLKYLANFEMFEAVSRLSRSTHLWDSLLSNGYYAYIVANDDGHDLYKNNEVGQFSTFINSESLHQSDVIKAMREGRTFGAEIRIYDNLSFEEKIRLEKFIEELSKVEVKDGILTVRTNTPAVFFSFIGQDGKALLNVEHSDSASYQFKDEDTYVRTEIWFPSQNRFYLNPVFRTEKMFPENKRKPEVNYFLSYLQVVIGFVVYGVIIFSIVFYIIVRRRKNIISKKE